MGVETHVRTEPMDYTKQEPGAAYQHIELSFYVPE
jgi:hypothetical protein